MDSEAEKRSLRALLLERRDGTSSDYLRIASERVRRRVAGIAEFRDAEAVGAYHPIGSEVRTQEIIQELLSAGKEVSLPRVTGTAMEFRRITGFDDLVMGDLGVMEPGDSCPRAGRMDAILVPTVGISPAGVRIGYGRGFYDRFLAGYGAGGVADGAATISLTLEKQIVRNIPRSDHDVPIDWIVTESRTARTRR